MLTKSKSEFSYSTDDEVRQQTIVIAGIGTNALPGLLRLLQIRDTPVRSNLVSLLRRQIFLTIHLHTATESHWLAINGFEALGPIAQPAVSTLTNLLVNQELRWSAALSLGAIGPAARNTVPNLIPWLTNSDIATRYCAARALAGIGEGAMDARPILLRQLCESNQLVRNELEFALSAQQAYPAIMVPILVQEIQDDFNGQRFEPKKIEALGNYGQLAECAVPLLLQISSKYHDETHTVRAALKKIDPKKPSVDP